jgi:hypothetical protein
MKCLECGADLLDSATFCPRCGTPTSTTTSFSYLPVGAPPWPATVPQGTSSTATAVKDPAQTAASARSAVEAKPRRSVGSIFTAFLLLLLSVVVGVGATLAILTATGSIASTTTASRQVIHLPTPIPTTTAAATGTGTTGAGTPAATPTTGAQGNRLPAPSSFVLVKFADLGISMKYPAEWIQEKPQTTANFTAIDVHPQQQIGIDFVVQRLSSSGSAQIKSVDVLNQSVLQPGSNSANVQNYKQIQPVNPAPTIAGIQWAEQDATFTNSQGILFHSVSISVLHNNQYYNINFLAPDVVYTEAMQKYYSQMLSSLQFIS